MIKGYRMRLDNKTKDSMIHSYLYLYFFSNIAVHENRLISFIKRFMMPVLFQIGFIIQPS